MHCPLQLQDAFQGKFLDLYTYGYYVPEAYAIEKDGNLYYAFFAPQQDGEWKGEVELRGLNPGTYHVRDYVEGKDLGTAESASGKVPKLAGDFTGLLLEAGH